MLSRAQWIAITVVGAALLAVPSTMAALDEPFYTSLIARILVFAIAVVSLDLILGYGGMVSFGHAAYLGIGAYAVAIPSYYGIDNGYLQLLFAVGGSALVALFIGAVSLRTSGLYFIMITLAFTQMLFYLGVSLEEYGGDDGINTNRSEFASWIDLYDDATLYYFVLACLAVCLVFSYRLVHSRFGRVIRGVHSNEARMQAMGFPTFRYKLTAFVISGAMCGVAGFLLANLTEFITPEYMQWSRSGELMIMVLMGGMGTLFGAVLGAIGFIALEEFIPDILDLFGDGLGQHWSIVLGPLLVVLVLFARGGLWGLLPGRKP
ncbi:MAG: branched-chain amino acid ABC transporter permease [Pseudomonadota bacterium]